MPHTARALETAPQPPLPLRRRLQAAPAPVPLRALRLNAPPGAAEPPCRADARRVAAYLVGDAGAFREIDSWIRREVFKRFSTLRNELEDLSQSVHWRLVIKLRDGAFGYRSTLRSYVSGITYHVAIDRLREVYRDRSVVVDSASERACAPESPYLSLCPVEASRLLDQVFKDAQPGCRALWRMVFLERMTYAEAARELSIPAGTVKSRVWHGRRRALALVYTGSAASPPDTPPDRMKVMAAAPVNGSSTTRARGTTITAPPRL